MFLPTTLPGSSWRFTTGVFTGKLCCEALFSKRVVFFGKRRALMRICLNDSPSRKSERRAPLRCGYRRPRSPQRNRECSWKPWRLTKQLRPEEAPTIYLSVGGLTGRAEGQDEHLRWAEQIQLKPGDKVEVEILETSQVEP